MIDLRPVTCPIHPDRILSSTGSCRLCYAAAYRARNAEKVREAKRLSRERRKTGAMIRPRLTPEEAREKERLRAERRRRRLGMQPRVIRTPEERRARDVERMRRWRANNPERARQQNRESNARTRAVKKAAQPPKAPKTKTAASKPQPKEPTMHQPNARPPWTQYQDVLAPQKADPPPLRRVALAELSQHEWKQLRALLGDCATEEAIRAAGKRLGLEIVIG